MRRLLLAAGIVLAAAPAMAQTHDFRQDTWCFMTDVKGNELAYSFGKNDGETVVETGFKKNNMQAVVQDQGYRPLWKLTISDPFVGLSSIDAPEWGILMDTSRSEQRADGSAVVYAVLYKSSRRMAEGICVAPSTYSDLGY